MVGNVIDLRKKSLIVLEKLGLAGVQANLVFAIDNSGSMATDIRNGTVQEQADRFIGLGMNLDPNKQIDVYTFDDRFKYVGTADESNHKDFVKNKGIRPEGSTKYSPVMHQIIAKYGSAIKPQVVTEEVKVEVERGFIGKLFGAKPKTVTETVTKTVQAADVKATQYPTIVFFMTDGANFDPDETEHVLREASKQGIFWQFIGIGTPYGGFPFLEKLDDLDGRFIDNADFTAVKDVAGISDEALYETVLKEFPGWLRQAKGKGLIL